MGKKFLEKNRVLFAEIHGSCFLCMQEIYCVYLLMSDWKDFNPRPVCSVSLTQSHRSCLRDVHTRAPNLQLLIEILQGLTGQYGLRAKYSA